jgi:hypothetical protein
VFFQDERGKRNKVKRKQSMTFIGLCPLTFDGAYGLIKAKHSIDLCSNKSVRRMQLYFHFINKHNLKAIYARRLVQAVANDQNPKTTKIFHGNADVIDHFYKTLCPFNNEMLDLFQYTKKKIPRVPCGYKSIPLRKLKCHLKNYHHFSGQAAEKIVNRVASIQTNDDVISV